MVTSRHGGVVGASTFRVAGAFDRGDASVRGLCSGAPRPHPHTVDMPWRYRGTERR